MKLSVLVVCKSYGTKWSLNELWVWVFAPLLCIKAGVISAQYWPVLKIPFVKRRVVSKLWATTTQLGSMAMELRTVRHFTNTLSIPHWRLQFKILMTRSSKHLCFSIQRNGFQLHSALQDSKPSMILSLSELQHNVNRCDNLTVNIKGADTVQAEPKIQCTKCSKAPTSWYCHTGCPGESRKWPFPKTWSWDNRNPS